MHIQFKSHNNNVKTHHFIRKVCRFVLFTFNCLLTKIQKKYNNNNFQKIGYHSRFYRSLNAEKHGNGEFLTNKVDFSIYFMDFTKVMNLHAILKIICKILPFLCFILLRELYNSRKYPTFWNLA